MGGGVAFLSYVVPQLGSDRVRLEPKSPQYLGQRGAHALPLSSLSCISLCCLSSSTLSNTFHLHEMWGSCQEGEGPSPFAP